MKIQPDLPIRIKVQTFPEVLVCVVENEQHFWNLCKAHKGDVAKFGLNSVSFHTNNYAHYTIELNEHSFNSAYVDFITDNDNKQIVDISFYYEQAHIRQLTTLVQPLKGVFERVLLFR